MKNKFLKVFNESDYANEIIDFECDCIPSIGTDVYMSDAALISLDAVLIVVKKGVFEFKIKELDDIKLHDKFLEKGLIIHSWKKNMDIKINFSSNQDRTNFFEQFEETFERLKLEYEYLKDNSSEEIIESNSKLPYEELKQLKELLDLGALTQEEFDAKKKQLLDL